MGKLNEKNATSLRKTQENQIHERVDERLYKLLTKDRGFYVEVGAGDGITDSPTLFLENYGWQGILIESNIERCAHCKINRPKAAVLNYECVANDYSDELVEEEKGGQENKLRDTKSNARTLTSILEEFEVKQIDLLVLNVNEHALNVFKELDLFNHRPDYILMEDGADTEIISSLADYHYKLLKTRPNNYGTPRALYQTAEKQLSDTSEDVIADNTRQEKLERAWDIAAKSNASYPGKYVAYYSLDVDGKHFSGERLWEDRWGYIGKALRDACGGDLKEKRILELGCNLGLLSVWAAREGAICHGYEYEADILEGSKLVASAFGVADRCKWSQVDFNNKEDTDSIVDEFDICTCLSVMNWVRNKEKLIDFLSRQKIVIYEGHDEDQIETGRLRQAGFAGIEKVAVSERGRGVFIGKKERTEKKIDWDEFERQYGLRGMTYQVPCVNAGDGNSLERVYFKTEVWKVRLSDRKNPAKFAGPHEEAQFLKTLKDVPNVCRLKEYIEKEDHTITIMDHFPNIGTLEKIDIPPEFRDKVEKQKHQIIKSVNNAGILHNDMFDRNFLVNSNYDICLIDFDQAQFAEGRNDYDDGYYYKAPKLKSIAEKQVDNIKREKLERAWDFAAKSNASYPGKYVAYYSLDVDGKHFSGERLWEDRWGYIGKALRDACGGDLKGKRILELGCNLGLLSVWAAREGAICHGYEYEADILEGSKLVASAFGVADRCSWSQTDFNSKAVTDKIADDFDLCTCLSVMNWVRDKNNLIDLLSRQKVVLYEGHEEDGIETGRLKSAGFSEIKKVAVSERNRGIFWARKGNLINKNSASKEEIPAMKNETKTLIEKMNSYKWYHSIKINENIVTPGRKYAGIWDIILKGMDGIDFNNKKVLDIGCRDGLFSFKAEESGASEIIGIDNEISKGAVDFLIPLFNSKVKMSEINLYDMEKKDFGTFDIILFPGVLYHLRFPFWALKRISDLLNENGILLVETALCNVENNKSVLYCPSENDSPYEPTSVTFFNLKGLIDTLKSFDLHVFNQKYSTEKNIFRQVVLAKKETISTVYGENKFGYTKKPATKEVVQKYWYGKGQKFYE